MEKNQEIGPGPTWIAQNLESDLDHHLDTKKNTLDRSMHTQVLVLHVLLHSCVMTIGSHTLVNKLVY